MLHSTSSWKVQRIMTTKMMAFSIPMSLVFCCVVNVHLPQSAFIVSQSCHSQFNWDRLTTSQWVSCANWPPCCLNITWSDFNANWAIHRFVCQDGIQKCSIWRPLDWYWAATQELAPCWLCLRFETGCQQCCGITWGLLWAKVSNRASAVSIYAEWAEQSYF